MFAVSYCNTRKIKEPKKDPEHLFRILRIIYEIELLQSRLFDCCVHEVFVSQRNGEESIYGIAQHVQVSVEIQRADSACFHDQIFCYVH